MQIQKKDLFSLIFVGTLFCYFIAMLALKQFYPSVGHHDQQPMPSPVKIYSTYDILNYMGKVYGVPAKKQFNWTSGNIATVRKRLEKSRSILSGRSVYEVEQKINFFKGDKYNFTEPSNLRSVLWFNLIGYKNRAYLIKFGDKFNPTKIDKKTKYIGYVSELKDLRWKLMRLKYFFSVPLLIDVKSNLNIVGFKKFVYAVPHGMKIDFNNIPEGIEKKLRKADTYFKLMESLGLNPK
jgi:hypothetical protein